MHRVQIEDIHKDLLAPHDKLSYGKYKSGDTAKPVGYYEDAILKERDILVSKSMIKHREIESAQAYVATVNEKIYDLLLRKQPIPAKAWLPSSPEPESPERVAPIYKDPLPGTVPRRLGKFVYPPKRNACGAKPRMMAPTHLQCLQLLSSRPSKLLLTMLKQTCLQGKLLMFLFRMISLLMKRRLRS